MALIGLKGIDNTQIGNILWYVADRNYDSGANSTNI